MQIYTVEQAAAALSIPTGIQSVSGYGRDVLQDSKQGQTGD